MRLGFDLYRWWSKSVTQIASSKIECREILIFYRVALQQNTLPVSETASIHCTESFVGDHRILHRSPKHIAARAI